MVDYDVAFAPDGSPPRRRHHRIGQTLRLGLRFTMAPLASAASIAALTAVASPAKALDFNWQFDITSPSKPDATSGTVRGTISGLLDNTVDQTTGLTVTVTSAPNTPLGGWPNDWSFWSLGPAAPGFSVSNGQVTKYDAFFKNSRGDQLYFGSLDDGEPTLKNFDFSYTNIGTGSGITLFSPANSVPGPLPILGAASAFGWSRRVRKRLRHGQPAARS